jgi:hypothetical protein
MARDNPPPDLSAVLAKPQISLMGEVDKFMARELRDGLRAEKRDGDGPVVVEITTAGGDAELVRRMVTDVDEARARLAPRRLVFSGKTMVYSAGTTLMSAFPVEDRYLSKDAMVMIHCRQLSKTVEIDGPIRGSLPRVTALLHQLETNGRAVRKGALQLVFDRRRGARTRAGGGACLALEVLIGARAGDLQAAPAVVNCPDERSVLYRPSSRALPA